MKKNFGLNCVLFLAAAAIPFALMAPARAHAIGRNWVVPYNTNIEPVTLQFEDRYERQWIFGIQTTSTEAQYLMQTAYFDFRVSDVKTSTYCGANNHANAAMLALSVTNFRTGTTTSDYATYFPCTATTTSPDVPVPATNTSNVRGSWNYVSASMTLMVFNGSSLRFTPYGLSVVLNG
jgi:hypothetical protein